MAISTDEALAGRSMAVLARFFRVGQLVPDDQEPLTVQVGTPAGQALELMAVNGFDQLPVVTSRNQVIGVFTYRSFARELRHLRIQDDPRAALVDDLVEELRYFRPSDNVEEILPRIEADNAVLVGDEDRLLAVVTAADVTNFLWRRTRPYILLQDIELATRDLMGSACSVEQLSECLEAALRDQDGEYSPKPLEELTLGELYSVLFRGESYGRYFRVAFGQNRPLVQTTLEPVRDIRNKVVHFRGEVSDEEYKTLDRALILLRRRVLMRGEA